MNTTAVCVAMPLAPFLCYFLLTYLGITSVCKVLVPAMFVVVYVGMVAVVVVKKAEREEEEKKRR